MFFLLSDKPRCKLPCLIHPCPKRAAVNLPLTRDIGRQIGQRKTTMNNKKRL